MKIALVMPLAVQLGGAELTLWHLMQHRQDTDVDWLVVFLEDGPMVAQLQSLGVETCLVRGGRLREPHLFMAAVTQIAAIARRSRADLIFSWMTKAHLYSSVAAMLAGIPSVWYQHGLPSSQSGMDKIATMLPACGILTCSKGAAEAQARLRPSRPIHIVYPGVEIDRFDPRVLPSPQEMRRKLDLPDSGPLIGIAARLQRWKGIHVLVEAMPQVLRSHPDAHCVVVGGKHEWEPDYPEYLESQIAALGIGDRIKMVGFQRNIPEWMQAMDVIVHASDYEPFGMVVVEAMALGKPVVAGARGGPSEIITDGVNGLLTPYGDTEALASAIVRYLDDREFARKLALAARERALDFSTQRYAQNFIQAIRDLIPSIS